MLPEKSFSYVCLSDQEETLRLSLRIIPRTQREKRTTYTKDEQKNNDDDDKLKQKHKRINKNKNILYFVK